MRFIEVFISENILSRLKLIIKDPLAKLLHYIVMSLLLFSNLISDKIALAETLSDPVLHAVYFDDVTKLKIILKQQPSLIHWKYLGGNGLLHNAILFKSYNCLKVLILAGANTSEKNNSSITPRMMAEYYADSKALCLIDTKGTSLCP